jgi:hypothetical protein
MLNILAHKGNANQNYVDIPQYVCFSQSYTLVMHRWLTPVILAIQEAENRKIMVQSWP